MLQNEWRISQKHCKIKAEIFFSVRPSPELCSIAFQLLKAQRLINEGSCSKGSGEEMQYLMRLSSHFHTIIDYYFFQAICCSDRIHCCPAGSECDLYHRTCESTQRNPTMTLAEAATELLKVQRKGE